VIGNAFFMGSVIYLPLTAGRFLLELLRRALSQLTPHQLLRLRAQAAAQAPLVARGAAALLAAALPAAQDAAAAAAAAAPAAAAAAAAAPAAAAAAAAARNATAAAAAVANATAAAAAPIAAGQRAAAVAAAAAGLHPSASEAALLAAVWGDPLPVAWSIGWDRLVSEIATHVSLLAALAGLGQSGKGCRRRLDWGHGASQRPAPAPPPRKPWPSPAAAPALPQMELPTRRDLIALALGHGVMVLVACLGLWAYVSVRLWRLHHPAVRRGGRRPLLQVRWAALARGGAGRRAQSPLKRHASRVPATPLPLTPPPCTSPLPQIAASVGRWTLSCAALVLRLAKLTALLTLELGAFPLAVGLWLDLCALPLTGATLERRAAQLARAPALGGLVHFLLGVGFMLALGCGMCIARQVLRPGALPFLRVSLHRRPGAALLCAHPWGCQRSGLPRAPFASPAAPPPPPCPPHPPPRTRPRPTATPSRR
jgi:hypothetical protein